MKKPLIYLLIAIQIIAFSLITRAQQYEHIDKHAFNAPKSVGNNAENLVKYLIAPTENDLEKVRAFYVWIAFNLEYDIQGFLNRKLSINDDIAAILKSRKGVCQDYSNLMKALCEQAGIQCIVLSGYSKGLGYNPKKKLNIPDHAWNAVKLGNSWYLLDATWASGYIDENYKFVPKFKNDYFLALPKRFVLSHLPMDPMWQLLDCPIDIELFHSDSLKIKAYIEKSKKCFSYTDSIDLYFKLSPIEQDLKTAINAYSFNPDNTINIGLAYMNYGVKLSETLMAEYKTMDKSEIIAELEKLLSIYLKSEQYLMESNAPEAKQILEICRDNIASAKENLSNFKQ